jgi:hypothetical protein
MTTGTVTIFASGNKAEIKSVNKADGKEITDLKGSRRTFNGAAAGGEHPVAPDQGVQGPPRCLPAGLKLVRALRFA